MTILLVILKILGAVLLLLLLLLLAALLLPLGLDIRYKAGRWQVQARYAMLHFTLYPPKSAPQQTPSPAPETPKENPPAAEKPNPPSATEAEPAQNTQKADKPQPPPKQPPETKPAAKAQAKPEPKPQAGGLPFGIGARLDAALALLQRDPVAFVKCAFGHLGWLGRGLAKSLRLDHVTVFWTVTGQDAAATAVSYGALLGALNTAWALLQQSVRVQADSLRLEPDFTGQQKANRCISLQVRSCAAVLLWLALRFARRLYKEPLWQPQKQETC
ncbi:hypothetical protein [uncultured Gemmiger sp.]|uniref:hypothetical protein n=1 Tax=uncultured Gemmiger sp. TaxID=1623490 RepID=UPI0025D43CA9|nr:hypothetical protein [uncultured Gemmiger sp.]